jgi:uncharacterized protein (TIGR02145 family)
MNNSQKNLLSGLVVGVFAIVVIALAVWGVRSLVNAPSAPLSPAGNSGGGSQSVSATASTASAAASPTDYVLTQNPDGGASVKLNTKDPFAMSFPASLASPVTITLTDNRTVQIAQLGAVNSPAANTGQGAADFAAASQDKVLAAVPDAQLASSIQENPILESYQTSDGQEEFYTYQKISGQPAQNLIKNWIVFNSPSKTNQIKYEIKNANVNINSSGDAEIFAAGNNAKGVSPDFVIPRPYFLDKNNQRTDLNWQFDAATHLLSVTFAAAPNQYPIALDPSVLKTDTVIATFSGKAISMEFTCGISTAAGRAPDTTVYQTVLGEDGRCWLASNLGTPNIATAYNDSTAYGWLYQWGRLTDGHQIPTSATTSTLSTTDNPGTSSFILAPSSPYDWRSPQNNNLWQGVSGTNNPCPIGWRLPTQTEWATYVTAAGITNYTTAFSSKLKLTAAGYRNNGNGGLYTQSGGGGYWSSSVSGTNAFYLYFDSGSVVPASSNYRANGFTVRCLKN